MSRLCLVGAGDFASLLLPHLRDGVEIAGFLDDTKSGAFAGLPILGGLGDLERLHAGGAFDEIVVAIGYRHLAFRAQLYARAQAGGIAVRSLVHPHAYVAPEVRLGKGVVVLPGCTIDSGAELADGVVLQVGTTISHHTRVAAHCFLGPGVTLAGYVAVGEQCFLGTGTIVIDHLTLGPRTRTGAGAVVTQSFPGDQLLVGVPARVASAAGGARDV